MKNLIILIFILITTLSFSQSVNVTEDVKTGYKNVNVVDNKGDVTAHIEVAKDTVYIIADSDATIKALVRIYLIQAEILSKRKGK